MNLYTVGIINSPLRLMAYSHENQFLFGNPANAQGAVLIFTEKDMHKALRVGMLTAENEGLRPEAVNLEEFTNE
jgi:hypothetical protein